MKKWFKLLSSLIAVMLVFSMLYGCSGNKGNEPVGETKDSSTKSENEDSGSAKKEPVKLVVWGGIPADKGPDEVMENYNKLMDGKVQAQYVRYVVGEGDAVLDTALLSGEHIDAYLSHGPDNMARRTNNKLALELSELMKKFDFDMVENFGEVAKTVIKPGGEVYTIPATVMGFFVLVNKDMLDEAGLEVPTDWTLDDLRDYAQKLTKGKGAEQTFGFFSHRPEVAMLLTEPTLDSDFYYSNDLSATKWTQIPEYKKALETLYNMQNVDETMPKYVEVVAQKMEEGDMFASERIAMGFGLSYIIRNIKDLEKYPHDFVTAFAPLPKANDDQDKYYTNQLLNDYFSINPKSEYKEEVFEFFKWFASEGYQPLIRFGRIPLYKGYNSDDIVEGLIGDKMELFDEESFRNTLTGEVQNAQVPKTYKAYGQIYQIMKEEYEKYITGNNDVDTMLSSLEERSNKALKEAK